MIRTVRVLQACSDRPMIRLRRAAERRHDRRNKRDVWRTFDAIDRSDRLGGCFTALEGLDESRLPPRADVPRRLADCGEIVTYVREGTVAYDDSMGHPGVIRAGEFQRMIAAEGAPYREANASRVAWAHVFQIRIRCALPEPGREQKRFTAAERRGRLCIVASPDARGGSLHLGRDAWIYSALLESGQHLAHELAPSRAAWLHVVEGEIALGDLVLATGDGAGVAAEYAVSLTARGDSEILLLDVASAAAVTTLTSP